MKAAFSVIALALLTSCAVNVPPGTTDPAKFSVETIQSSQRVAVSPTVPAGSTTLREISATSCQRYKWDQPPTEETALILLKAKAHSQGVDNLGPVTYRHYNMSISDNCYGTIVASSMGYIRK